MDKVKITRELANAIDYYKGNHGDFWKHHLLSDAVECERYIGKVEFANEVKVFTESGGLDLILQSLVNGYEVEETTPEDKVRLNYEVAIEHINRLSGQSDVDYWKGVREGVVNTLATLNIKIVGVNHE